MWMIDVWVSACRNVKVAGVGKEDLERMCV